MAGLSRFIEAQTTTYDTAVAELKRGQKTGHWMWFVFPQIAGLGVSPTARFYAIADLDEARAFLAHPLLARAWSRRSRRSTPSPAATPTPCSARPTT